MNTITALFEEVLNNARLKYAIAFKDIPSYRNAKFKQEAAIFVRQTCSIDLDEQEYAAFESSVTDCDDLNQGQSVTFKAFRPEELDIFLSEKDSFLLDPTKDLVISKVFGQYIMVKEKGNPLNITTKYYHYSRFIILIENKMDKLNITESGLIKSRTDKFNDVLDLFVDYPTLFISSKYNEANTFRYKAGDSVYHITETAGYNWPKCYTLTGMASTLDDWWARDQDNFSKILRVTEFRPEIKLVHFYKDQNSTFTIGSSIRFDNKTIDEALEWMTEKSAYKKLAKDAKYLNIAKEFLLGNEFVIYDIVHLKDKSIQFAIRISGNEDFKFTGYEHFLFATNPDYVYTVGKWASSSQFSGSSGYKTESWYEKKEREEREAKEELEKDIKAGPYNLDKYIGKVVDIKGLAGVAEGLPYLVVEANNDNGRLHVKTFEGRAEKEYILRHSQGHLDHVQITGDIVFCDEETQPQLENTNEK